MKEIRPQLNHLQEFSYAETAVLAGIMTTGEAIALRPVVENLGLDWSSQLKKIKRDYKLNQLWSSYKVASTDGKSYEMVCLSPANFQEWLWSIKVSENVNVELLETYKKGLVVYLLMMLKISLDKVQELQFESGYVQEIRDTQKLMDELDAKIAEKSSDLSELKRERKNLYEKLKYLLRNNPNQLKLEI